MSLANLPQTVSITGLYHTSNKGLFQSIGKKYGVDSTVTQNKWTFYPSGKDTAPMKKLPNSMAAVVDHSVRSPLTLYLARRQLRFATNLILFCLANLIATIIPAARQELARVPTKPSQSFMGLGRELPLKMPNPSLILITGGRVPTFLYRIHKNNVKSAV